MEHNLKDTTREKEFMLTLDRFKTGIYELRVGDPEVEITAGRVLEGTQGVLVIEFMYRGERRVQSVVQDEHGGSIYTDSGRMKVWLALKLETLPFSPIQYTHTVTCQYPTHRVECASGMWEILEIHIPKHPDVLKFKCPIIVYVKDRAGKVSSKAVQLDGTNSLGMQLILVEILNLMSFAAARKK